MLDGSDSTNLNALVGDESATAVAVADLEETTEETTVGGDNVIETEQDAASVNLNWAVPLADSGNAPVEFTEFERASYRFEEVHDPDGNPTGMYAVYYKDLDMDEPVWKILRAGLLSEQYVAAHVETFYEELSQQVEFVGTPEINSSHPFLLTVFGNTVSEGINPLGDEENALAFEIVSGIDRSVLTNADTRIKVCVSNSYSGTNNISIDYIVHISLRDPNNNVVNFRDFFTLSRQSHHFTHRTYSLGEVSSRLTQIPEQYINSMNVLKSVTHRVDDHVNKTSKILKKAERNILLGYWEQIPTDHKNMLVFLMLLSYCLDLNYSVSIHQNLKSYVAKEVELIFRSQEQE